MSEPTPRDVKDRAVLVQRVARLPIQGVDGGASPTARLHFTTATAGEVAPLLTEAHYLGPTAGARYCHAGWVDDELVAAMVWRWPTARLVPDGWLELSRWCLTREAGRNAGSRMMRWVAGWFRRNVPTLRTLVSYSDPTIGHTGALYRASGWVAAPTHHQLRYEANGVGYPSGHGSWDGRTVMTPKARWIFHVRGSG